MLCTRLSWPALLAAGLAAALLGCGNSTITNGADGGGGVTVDAPGGGPTVDAPGGGPTVDAPGGGPTADAAPTCDQPNANPPGGRHNAGRSCLDCHGNGAGGAPIFTLAGTLYSDVNGSSPVAGATIHIRDHSGNDITIVTADNGNFWTTQSIAYPATASASSCPNTVTMKTSLQSSSASCNKSGCHASGFRIHLP